MNFDDLRERLRINAPLTPDQRDFLLSLLDPWRPISPGDIFQIDPRLSPAGIGGLLLVASEVDAAFATGLLPEWGAQQNGLMTIKAPIDRVKHTGGKLQWPFATVANPESPTVE